MKEEKPTILDRMEKNKAGEEATFNFEGEDFTTTKEGKKAFYELLVEYGKRKPAKQQEQIEEIQRTILEEDIEIREIGIPIYEIDMPGSVLAALDVNPEIDSVRFVEENGRVYLEKA